MAPSQCASSVVFVLEEKFWVLRVRSEKHGARSIEHGPPIKTFGGDGFATRILQPQFSNEITKDEGFGYFGL
jgi:hypothetical protein